MNFLVWRLHRNQIYFAVAALAVLAVVLLVTGTVMGDDYRSALASCGATQSCGDLGGQLFRGDGAIVDLVDLTLVVPLLFGLFWGAPLLSKEFEDGTHNLAWTQGVSRRLWLRVNIGWSLVAAALWGAALAALVSYWRFPENAVNSRFQASTSRASFPWPTRSSPWRSASPSGRCCDACSPASRPRSPSSWRSAPSSASICVRISWRPSRNSSHPSGRPAPLPAPGSSRPAS